MIGFIFIYKRKSLEGKIEIYYQIMDMIEKNIFKSLLLYIIVKPKTLLEKIIVENLLIMYTDKCI